MTGAELRTLADAGDAGAIAELGPTPPHPHPMESTMQPVPYPPQYTWVLDTLRGECDAYGTSERDAWDAADALDRAKEWTAAARNAVLAWCWETGAVHPRTGEASHLDKHADAVDLYRQWTVLDLKLCDAQRVVRALFGTV